MRLAVDIGGTFTDLTAVDDTGSVFHAKRLTTNDDLSRGVAQCVDEAGVDLADAERFLHGSTIAINTVIQRDGAATALITTSGFRDVYEIGRSNRPDAYNLLFERPVPLVPREWRFEVDERLDAKGCVLKPLDEAAVRSVAARLADSAIEAVAIVLLHAYANPAHEIRVGEILAEACPGVHVSMSHAILREFREYERTSTTVLNAYVAPVVDRYLGQIEAMLTRSEFDRAFLVMQSNGGAMSVAQARGRPVATMESGPVAGVIGAGRLGQLIGHPNVIAFDMGGTTAKTSLVIDGDAPVVTGYHIGGPVTGHPMMLPVVDIVEIGAGGGSIAWIDPAGALKVGPQSAGASPGPVCYGLGGSEPTVTDANLVLGRLRPDGFLGGRMTLDGDAAQSAIREKIADPLGLSVEAAARGILTVVDTRMSLAVREVSVAKGHDARDFALVASGGAGPLHAVSVARELSIPKVIVPSFPGTFSAHGMLLADLRHDYVQTMVSPLRDVDHATLNDRYRALEREGIETLATEGLGDAAAVLTRSMDLRYQGQEYTLPVPVPAGALDTPAVERIAKTFHDVHRARYAQSAPGESVELVNLRLRAIGKIAGTMATGSIGRELRAQEIRERTVVFGEDGPIACPLIERSSLGLGDFVEGPALIEEPVSTTVLHPGTVARVADCDALVIEVDTT